MTEPAHGLLHLGAFELLLDRWLANSPRYQEIQRRLRADVQDAVARIEAES